MTHINGTFLLTDSDLLEIAYTKEVSEQLKQLVSDYFKKKQGVTPNSVEVESGKVKVTIRNESESGFLRTGERFIDKK